MGKGGGGQSQGPSSGGTSVTVSERPYWAQQTAKNLLSRGEAISNYPYAAFPYVYQPGQTIQTTDPNNPFTMLGMPQTQTTYSPGSYYNIKTGETLPEGSRLPYTSMIAPLSAETELGLQGVTNRALTGSPINTNASNLSAGTLAGNYLNPETNPYLKATYQQAADAITNAYQKSTIPQLQAAANRAGAFGGSADALLQAEAMKNLGTTLSDTATNIYGGNYANERKNQMQALALAPTTAQQEYADMNALLGAGDVRNQYSQSVLSDLANQWNMQQQYPYNQSNFLGNILNAAVGNTGTQTTTTSGSSTYPSASLASRIMGGATSGAGLGLMASSLGASNPLSAALGFIPFLGSLF